MIAVEAPASASDGKVTSANTAPSADTVTFDPTFFATPRTITLTTGALPIRQDARLLAATLKSGQSVAYQLGEGRYAYVALAKGKAKVNGVELGPRDGAAIKDETELRIEAGEDAEIVLVDAP